MLHIVHINDELETQFSHARKMARATHLCKDLLPFSAIVTLECANVGLNTLFKAATEHGLNYHVYVIYAYGVAALILLPSPFFSYRSRALPPMTFSIMSKIFLLGLIGCISLLSGYTGLNYSSPTLASAMSNLVPAFTFVLSIIFRMEKLKLSSSKSQAKIGGTIVSILGACLVTLYKGPQIMSTPNTSTLSSQPLYSTQSNWVIGGLLLAIQYLLVPVWYIVQAQIMKEYPAESTVVFFYNLYVSVMAASVTCVIEPDFSKWRLGSYIALASVLCQGFFGACCSATVQTWVIRLKGPVYVAMFKPLSIAIAVAMGVIFLGDSLYLGSIIGAIFIAAGFYTVMWGKTNEETGENSEASDLESSTTQKVTLLQSSKNQNS